MSESAYEFEGLPIEGIRPGTTVLLSGPRHGGTRTLGLRMLNGPDGEGSILVSTNDRAERIADALARCGVDISPDCTAILDCVGDEAPGVPARVLQVSSPSDLTGIGMRYSDIYREFGESGIERVRTGIVSVSTLLSYGDLKTVGRFVHTLVGRINAVDGLGVFFVDPTMHDDRTVSTLTQFCSGRIDVREADEGSELRVRGLAGQSREWRPFDPDVDWAPAQLAVVSVRSMASTGSRQGWFKHRHEPGEPAAGE